MFEDDGPKKSTLVARPSRKRYSREERLTLHFCKLTGVPPATFIGTHDAIAMERKLRRDLRDKDGLLATTRDVQTVLDLLAFCAA